MTDPGNLTSDGQFISVLGPLRVSPKPPTAEKVCTVLAMLAADPERRVSNDQLFMELWGDNPPPSAQTTLQTYILQLRRLLGQDAIRLTFGGYILALRSDNIDAFRLEDSVKQAWRDVMAGELQAAQRVLASAAALVHGEPLENIKRGPHLEAWHERIVKRLREADLLRIMLELSFGRHRIILPDLQKLHEADPFAEEVVALLMLALYRCGHMAEAATTWIQLCTNLRLEHGLLRPEPDSYISQLHARILVRDSSLVPQPSASDELKLLLTEVVP